LTITNFKSFVASQAISPYSPQCAAPRRAVFDFCQISVTPLRYYYLFLLEVPNLKGREMAAFSLRPVCSRLQQLRQLGDVRCDPSRSFI